MKRIFSAVAFIIIAGIFVGCGGLELEKAQKTQPPTDEFARGLHGGYLQLSEAEYAEGDYLDSDVFAEGAIGAAEGKIPDPEETGSRDLPEDKVAEVAAARERLMAALNKSARTRVPASAARAQVMFDCWIQEQEENSQPHDIAACHNNFEQAMAEVETAVAEPEVTEAAPTPTPAPPAAKAPIPQRQPEEIQRSYLIFFDWDSASIIDEAAELIEIAARTAKEGKIEHIIATGHTDLSGSAKYNIGLSDRRSQAVKEALVRLGIPASEIETIGLGETNPLVETPDGERELQNRRVEITLSMTAPPDTAAELR